MTVQAAIDPSEILYGELPARHDPDREPDGAGGWVYVNRIPTSKGKVVFRTRDQRANSVNEARHLGLLHSAITPAVIEKGPDVVVSEQWWLDGLQHREGAPAEQVKLTDGFRRERWFRYSQLHRKDGPAEVAYHRDGSRTEDWYELGERHREDGPASVITGPDGQPTRTEYCVHGEKHREDGPAVVYLDERHAHLGPGPHVIKEWYELGEMHREGEAARTIADANGERVVTEYYVHGRLHREDGPARIRDNEDLGKNIGWGLAPGSYSRVEFYQEGELHREHEPALMITDAKGQIVAEEWWLWGKQAREPEDLPATFRLRPDGSVSVHWYVGGNENPEHSVPEQEAAGTEWLKRIGRA